jgi:hypothetical protein
MQASDFQHRAPFDVLLLATDIVGEFKKTARFDLKFLGCQARTSNAPTIS